MFIVNSSDGKKILSESKIRQYSITLAKARASTLVDDSAEEQDLFELKGHISTHKESSAIKAYEDNIKPKKGKLIVVAEEIMTRNVMTVQSSETVDKAWQLMAKFNINHLPVYGENKSLVGLISTGDILKKLVVNDDGLLANSRIKLVEELMNKEVFSTLAKTDIRKIALVMSEFNVGSVLIVNNFDELLGIISSRDLVRRLAKEPPIELYV